MAPNAKNFIDNVKADPRLIGFPNCIIPFAQHISSPRVSMTNHQLGQAMIVAQPEFNKLFTGAEHQLGKYTFGGSKRIHDCEIVAVVPKYTDSFLVKGKESCPEIYVIVLAIDDVTGERKLDYFTINRYYIGTNGFGFVPELENLHHIQVGNILDKNVVISHSPAVKGNQYCVGTNLNTIYGSFPETIEDAFIISETAARKLESTQVSKVVINCRADKRPINLNGDEVEYKFLPDIGTHVRPDGALCGFRPVHWTTCVADSDPAALRQALPLQDEIIYIEPGAKIVDITFNINLTKLNDCYQQALLYMKNNNKCWESIYQVYLNYKGKFHLTQEMSTLVNTAVYRMIAQGTSLHSIHTEFSGIGKNPDIEGDNGQVVDFLQAIVHYVVPRPVSNGAKLSDFFGGKLTN